ncbi:MAG: hypothetical protein WC856_02175 [Methylococcaceae bacterium]|jgi:hypothetical protein
MEHLLTEYECFTIWDDHIDDKSIPEIVNYIYRKGYEQAVKDMEHFEETGVVIF